MRKETVSSPSAKFLRFWLSTTVYAVQLHIREHCVIYCIYRPLLAAYISSYLHIHIQYRPTEQFWVGTESHKMGVIMINQHNIDPSDLTICSTPQKRWDYHALIKLWKLIQFEGKYVLCSVVVTFMGVYICTSRVQNPMWCLSCMYHKYAVLPIGTHTKWDPWVLSAPPPWHCLAKNIHNYSWRCISY